MLVEFELRADTVHIWRCALSSDDAVADLAVLDDTERAKAAAYRFERDRCRYVVGRAFLKALLGRYLNVPRERISLSSREFGKPFLSDHAGLSFNVSHCDNVYVVALGVGPELGIDVEVEREVQDLHDTASMVFSAEELAALADVPRGEQSRAFLQGWTRKEAFLKACGVGIGVDLKAITVGLELGCRLVPPIAGMSTQPYAVHSVGVHDEHIALACCPSVSRISTYDVGALRDLRTVPCTRGTTSA